MRPAAAHSQMKTGSPFLERHFHAGMAWFFVIVAVAGFAPRSLAIVSGMMPSPPLVVHPHAAVMASLRTRRTDPEMNKRMMLLATLMLLDAAIVRMSGLPYNEFPKRYLASTSICWCC
jgi:hypothetical protein